MVVRLSQWVLWMIGAVWVALLPVTPAFAAMQAQEGDLDLGLPASAQRNAPALWQPLFAGCSPATVTPVNPDFEQQLVERVNDHRASIGRPPLKSVPQLDQSARYHVRDMRDDAYFSHDTYDRVNGQTVKVCDWDQRINNYYTGWLWLGENIAAGYTSPASVMNAWLNSSGHRSNIESTDAWEIGIGYDAGGYYGHYWTQDFGRRANVYPLVIQREYSRTATPAVSVFIYGNWQQMRLRNDAGPWSAWQPFYSTFTWQLNWVQGTRQLCAEVQSGSQTMTTCDTIELTTSAPALLAQPAQVSFVYVLSTGQRFPQTASLSLTTNPPDQALSWQVGAAPAWLTITPNASSTPNPNVQLTLNVLQIPGAPGLYTGVAQFNATNANVGATVNVSVRVVSSLPYRSFAPLVRR